MPAAGGQHTQDQQEDDIVSQLHRRVPAKGANGDPPPLRLPRLLTSS